MRVRAKVTVLLGLLFAALLAAQWAIQQRLVLPRFVDLERERARTDMQRVVLAVEREQQARDAQAADWGNWNETWKYMQRHNAAYVHDTLTDTAVRTLKVDYLALLTQDGRIDWSRALDPRSGKRMTIRLNRTDQLESGWSRALERGVPVSGLIATNAGFLIAAGAPILDGFGRGPARGMVIVGRLLNAAELLRLSTQAQVQLDMRLLPAHGTTAGARSGSFAAVSERLTESTTTTRIVRTFSSLAGEPLLELGISVPRHISHRGSEAVGHSTRMVAIAACIVLAALLALLSRIVLGPLAAVTDHAQRIALADDLSARLGYQRRDELGTLARAFDDMVERLAQTRRELVDRSFESGAAENASGVLHNLGNAMTPLAVNVTGLQEQLGAMPAANLQLGFDELQQDTGDAQRQRDLRQFLQLSMAELRRVQAQASARLRDIIGQTEIMQAVLAEQQQHQRNGPVLLPVTPAELVTRSLQQVAPVHRERLVLDISPGLAALGELSLPCTSLGMVLQNLIQNAAESAACAGQARARLRIEAEVIETDGRRGLRLALSDSAGVVAPENLPRLFQKGFSTKSHATNSEFGLHWCANALAALGGAISVHSDGIGRGTRFEIRLPLREADLQAADTAA